MLIYQIYDDGLPDPIMREIRAMLHEGGTLFLEALDECLAEKLQCVPWEEIKKRCVQLPDNRPGHEKETVYIFDNRPIIRTKAFMRGDVMVMQIEDIEKENLP